MKDGGRKGGKEHSRRGRPSLGWVHDRMGMLGLEEAWESRSAGMPLQHPRPPARSTPPARHADNTCKLCKNWNEALLTSLVVPMNAMFTNGVNPMSLVSWGAAGGGAHARAGRPHVALGTPPSVFGHAPGFIVAGRRGGTHFGRQTGLLLARQGVVNRPRLPPAHLAAAAHAILNRALRPTSRYVHHAILARPAHPPRCLTPPPFFHPSRPPRNNTRPRACPCPCPAVPHQASDWGRLPSGNR